jgi:hypothetical protein
VTNEIAEFTVQRAAAQDYDATDTYILALGQGRGGEGGSLVFSVNRSHDEQDRALGLDTYDITVGDGSRIYGGLESLVRDGDVIKVRITAEAASTLGLPEEFRIALQELSEDEKAQVSPGFERLFELAGHQPEELVL